MASRKPALNPDYFTGKTRLSDLSDKLGSGSTKIYQVEFPDGSHTKLHRHTGAQILMGTSGAGSLEFYEKTSSGAARFGIRQTRRVRLVVGSMAYIPPRTLHAHGATRKNDFAHIAINLPSGKLASKTTWYESSAGQVTGRI